MKEYIKCFLGMTLGFFMLFVGVFLIIDLSERHDKEQFNNGICINCGEKLEPFGVDKYGNVVWICDDCGYSCVN